MVDCKVAILQETGQRASPHAAEKINSLCDKSIKKYLEYVGSLKKDGELPDPLPEGKPRQKDEQPEESIHYVYPPRQKDQQPEESIHCLCPPRRKAESLAVF